MNRILKLTGIGVMAASAMLAQARDYRQYGRGQNYVQPQIQTYGSERSSYRDQPVYQQPQWRDNWNGEGNRNSYYRDDYYRNDRDRDGDRDDSYRFERARPFNHSAAIVGGSAAVGAIVGGLAGEGRGAAIGALSGGVAGFVSDRLTHNHDRY